MSTAPAMLRFAFVLGVAAHAAHASDHLDAPAVIDDPAADIGDLYAWMSPDGRRLNLVMDIVGTRFSDRIAYVFHVDSGARVGDTVATATIDCRFDALGRIACTAAGDRAAGTPDVAAGLVSERQRFRVFAGVRDDPFANNVRGTRQAYEVAAQALAAGAARDAAGCPAFDADVSARMLDRWRHTDGGPAQDFLGGWKTGALIVSIDVGAVAHGGPLLAVWTGTYASDGERIDRVGRPLTGNALLGPLDPDDVVGARKERYNRAPQRDWPAFVPDIERTLGLYDAFDGVCGNQWRAASGAKPGRYRALAALLADDRVWVDSRSTRCERFMAVERRDGAAGDDCGGRTPDSDAVDAYRSLLVNGTTHGVDDGVARDDAAHSAVAFPFLAPP